MIHLISCPYDLGHRDVGMGAGPTAFVTGGLTDRLAEAGHDAEICVVEYDGSVGHEAGAAIAVTRQLTAVVSRSVAAGAFPIVFGGNCNVCLGVMAGVGRSDLGMVWLDAHGDFHSTDSTVSGFFDGFPLSMAVGRTWKALTATIDNFDPMPEDRVLLAGARDIDAGEDELIAQSALRTYDLAAFARDGLGGFAAATDSLSGDVGGAYLHVDLDVIDGNRYRVNPFAPGGGLAPEDLVEAVAIVGRSLPIVATSLNCYDPVGDPDGEALAVGIDVVVAMAGARTRS